MKTLSIQQPWAFPDLAEHLLNIKDNIADLLIPFQQKKTRKALLEYCGLDTFAMVKIWERLRELISS